MKMTSEEETLANIFMVLKGNKRKREDWISIAKKCNYILQKSNSIEDAAKKLGVSYELLRGILSILKLPKEVQQLVKNGDILFDAAQRINRIKDPDRQKEAARIVAGLKSHEQREIIQYAKKYPKASLSDFTKRVISPVDIEKFHVVIIPLEDKIFQVVDEERKKQKNSLEKILVNIVEQWVVKQK